MRRNLFGVGVVICAVLAATVSYMIFQPEIRALDREPYETTGRPVAVIGDSDSHIYRDHVNGVRRGGEYHDTAFQWTEIWDRLRGDEVEQGELGVWGTYGKVARIRRSIGLEARIFEKMDFRFNYSVSGARCASLYRAYPYQAQSLLSLMKRESEWFQNGLVFVRIGINDFGQKRHLIKWAKTGFEGVAADRVKRCLQDIGQVVTDVLSLATNNMLVLVDVSHDYNGSSFGAERLSPAEVNRMLSVLKHFESGLRKIAASSNRVAYVDAVSHTRRFWGDRFLRTQRREMSLGGSAPVLNAVGDEPYNRTLLDGHAGTINNGLWLQFAIQQINEQLGTGFTPLRTREIAALADPSGEFGIAPQTSDDKQN